MMTHFPPRTGLEPSLNLPKRIPKPEPTAAGSMPTMPSHRLPTLIGLRLFWRSPKEEVNRCCIGKIADYSLLGQAWWLGNLFGDNTYRKRRSSQAELRATC